MTFIEHIAGWRAELDAWRLLPRVLIVGYSLLFYNSCEWFMSLTDPTMPQAAYLGTLSGAGAAVFGLFVNSEVVKSASHKQHNRRHEEP